MERNEIARRARKMENREDLLRLLSDISRDEMAERSDFKTGDRSDPFTMRQLCYYANPNLPKRYRQFKIRKKTPGQYRQISAPDKRTYLRMLRSVNEILKSLYSPSPYAYGFAEGRSVVDNAMGHKNKNYVFNTDLRDFFPSIEQPRVWKRLQRPPFNFPQTIANLIAGLCSMRTNEIINAEKNYYRCILPQGAPTSPLLTNAICDKLDRRLAGLARRFGLSYSRYADDITFSSMHNVYQDGSPFRLELGRIIEEQGFQMNASKTRLQKRGERQEVTGLTVNERINVTQGYVRNLRDLLYIWKRYGYMDASIRFILKYQKEKGHVRKGIPDMVSVVGGKLQYLRMVKNAKDPVYVRLESQFEQLKATLAEPERTTTRGLTLVETLPLVDFEKKMKTKVTIDALMSIVDKEYTDETDKEDLSVESLEKKINVKTDSLPRTKSMKAAGKVFKCEKKPSWYAYFTLRRKNIYLSIEKSLKREWSLKLNKVKSTDEVAIERDHLYVSLCRDPHDKHFWLLHQTLKSNISQPPRTIDLFDLDSQSVDLDQLNSDLESLIQ